jgi:hypothetical protein
LRVTNAIAPGPELNAIRSTSKVDVRVVSECVAVTAGSFGLSHRIVDAACVRPSAAVLLQLESQPVGRTSTLWSY